MAERGCGSFHGQDVAAYALLLTEKPLLRSLSKESARPDAPDPRRRIATRRLAHNPTMGFTIVRRPASTARAGGGPNSPPVL
jgi:hypothetical protein